MSKNAIIVENLAWLYAEIIQGVMMGGLEDLTSNASNTAEQHQSLNRALSGVGQSQLQLASSSNSSRTTLTVSDKVSQSLWAEYYVKPKIVNSIQVDYVGQRKIDALNERHRLFVEKLAARKTAEAKAEKKRNRTFFGRKRS